MQLIANGAKVHYEITGDGSRKVLLLHGWGCSMELMKPVAASLAGDFSMLMLDFPGHGESGRPPAPWGVEDYAACVREVLDQLHFVPCAVVAHSFGCRVAAVLAAGNPALFTRLVLTGAAGLKREQTAQERRRSALYTRLKKICQILNSFRFLGPLPEGLEDALRKKFGSADYNALDEEMRATFVKVIRQDLRDEYSRMPQSTLLLWGEKDTETPLWMGRELEESMQDAGLVLLEGGTHFAYLEQLPRFSRIVRYFLMEA